MSYILDALRKSDQQRQRGVAPITLAAQPTLAAPKQPAFSSSGLLAAVLVGAGILIGWLRPWQSEQAVPALEPVAVQPLAASPRLALPAPPPVLPEQAAKSEHAAPLQKSTASEQTANPSGSAALKRDTAAVAKAETPATSLKTGVQAPIPMPDKPAVTDLADAELERRVMAFTELPVSIQQEIPSLSISLHSYAGNPKDRFVMIGDKLLRQGEFLAPGLRLEQITSDGVVISYKKYRFHRGVR